MNYYYYYYHTQRKPWQRILSRRCTGKHKELVKLLPSPAVLGMNMSMNCTKKFIRLG